MVIQERILTTDHWRRTPTRTSLASNAIESSVLTSTTLHSSHLTSSSWKGIQFGFNHIQFGPIRNQPSRFFFRDQQLHTCTPEWEIAQTNQHNRTLQTRIHSHIQPPKATLRDHPPHPQILPFQHLQNTLEPTNKYPQYHPNRAVALDFLR